MSDLAMRQRKNTSEITEVWMKKRTANHDNDIFLYTKLDRVEGEFLWLLKLWTSFAFHRLTRAGFAPEYFVIVISELKSSFRAISSYCFGIYKANYLSQWNIQH